MSLGMTYQLAASPDGAARRFIQVSDSCVDLLGIPAQALRRDSTALFALVAEDHRELTMAATTRAILARKPMMVEFAIRKPDGETRWLRATSAPRAELLIDPPGWGVWDGLIIDITDPKRDEQELQAQRHRLDLAVEATGLGFFDYDIRANRSVWSDRSKALYGLPPEAELEFDHWFEHHIHPEDRPLMEAAYLAALGRPDGMFSVEHRALAPDGGVRWLLVHGRVLRDEAGPHSVLGTAQDITERRIAEERTRLLTDELAHRAKNGLAMMLAIVAQSARSAATVAELETAVSARIQAMARAQDLLTGERRPVALARLVASAVAPFDVKRIIIDPALGEAELPAANAFALTLLLHELATNATKYGALSTAAGRVNVGREAAASGMVTLCWREQGGPPVSPPTRQGFGSRLMQFALKPAGEAVAAWLPAGLEARLTFADIAQSPPAGE